MGNNNVRIDIHQGDARDIETDILALKHMENAEGVGKVVADAIGLESHRLENAAWIPDFRELPDLGESKLFNRISRSSTVNAQNILYIGVQPAPDFRYQDIRQFTRRSLVIANRQLNAVKHVTFTLHGPGYGLDEREAFESELAGVIDAIQERVAPDTLERISFVEIDPVRANRLETILQDFIPNGLVEKNEPRDTQTRSVGYDSESKPHVFVAMPFDEDLDDVYFLGIQDAVHSADFLCERVDHVSFTGDILDQIQERIESASLVIADMTDANPNVYLEVGYAWGNDVSTLLLSQDTDHLKFDVQRHNTIVYDRNDIRGLKNELSETLTDFSIPSGR